MTKWAEKVVRSRISGSAPQREDDLALSSHTSMTVHFDLLFVIFVVQPHTTLNHRRHPRLLTNSVADHALFFQHQRNPQSRQPMAEAAPSINLAQIIALLVIGYFAVQAVRSYLSPAGANQSGGSSDRRAHNGSRVNPAHVEQVAQMFPQLDRRTIMWDLQRNGGSVQATSERVLTGRGLEVVSRLHLMPNII